MGSRIFQEGAGYSLSRRRNRQYVWKRVERQLLEIAKRPYERVAVFCHGGTFMSATCGAIGLPQQFRFCLGGDVENTSITILNREGGLVLHGFNDYAHLRTP